MTPNEKDIDVVTTAEVSPAQEAPKEVSAKFAVGQEVQLQDGRIGKVLEVRGTAADGFRYGVAHGVLSDLSETDISEIK